MTNPQTLTEPQRKGEFVAGLLTSISMESGTLASGHADVLDGTPLVQDGANVKPAVGDVATDGSLDEDFVGLAYGNYDSSAGAVEIVYVARLIEVDASLLHYPEVTDQAPTDAALDAALAAKFIIKR